MLERFATAVKDRGNRIRIRTSCEISAGYTEEYVIEDIDGNVICAWNFPSEWNGKVFQLVEDIGSEQTREQLEEIILDLTGRHDLTEDEVRQLQEAEEKLGELKDADSKRS